MESNFRAFSNTTQLFGIVLSAVPAGGAAKAKRALVALPPEEGVAAAFATTADEVAVWSHDLSAPEGFQALPPQGPFDFLAYYLPKAREYQAFTFELALTQLAPGARVIVAGPKQGGAGSVKEMLQIYLGADLTKHAARHCVAWEGHCQTAPARAPLAASQKTFAAAAWGVSAQIRSYPGVFSHGRLDEGTHFLLERIQIKDYPFTHMLDWGCGAGVIGTLAKLVRPEAKVTFADSHAMALESTRETLKANHQVAEAVFASDGWSQVTGNFDLILSNPPAHRGFDTDLSATEKFLAGAPKHLLPGGRLILVANAHLPYLGVMNPLFKKVSVLAKNTQFQILEGMI